ncbi:MAG: DUF1302 family protein [bacterium]
MMAFPPHRIAVPLLLAWLLCLPALPALAQGKSAAEEPEDILSGFDDPLPEDTPEKPPDAVPDADFESGFEETPLEAARPTEAEEGEPDAAQPFWELGGFIRLDGSYNFAHKAPEPGQTDYRGLSKLRLALQLELSLQLAENWRAFISGQAFRDFAYGINGREQYTQAVLDQHEDEAEFREVFLLGTPIASLDAKVGRQIVVWGKSDNIRVVDVLNPLDNREPGLTDLEDLRLPVTMTRLDYYFGDWSLTGIAVHEVRFNKDPAPGSDFFPFDPPPPEVLPDDGGENTEYAAALSGIFSGWDLAFYWAQVFDDQAHVEDIDPGPGEEQALVHARITMVGAAVNVALGNWLLKSEAARFTGLEFFTVPERTFTRVDGLLGAEYAGITDTTLSFEAVDRHLFEFDKALEQEPIRQSKDVNQYVLTYRGSFLREQLDLVAVLSFFGAKGEQGSLQRYSATYELATALDLTGGVVLFTPGEGENFLLVSGRDNDRAFFELKWSF